MRTLYEFAAYIIINADIISNDNPVPLIATILNGVFPVFNREFLHFHFVFNWGYSEPVPPARIIPTFQLSTYLTPSDYSTY